MSYIRFCLVLILTTSAAFVLVPGLLAQAPRLTGANPPLKDEPAPPLPREITDDVRRMRNYPEQPPVIPHAIDGYQLTVTTNRCISCHKREFVEGSGAPMISITHFMDREGQMLADISPRRYFCLQCHVQQTDAKPLVENTFRDVTGTMPSSGRQNP